MAKQIGAMPISGKIDNLVYYNTKNGGAVVRRAYPNLGKRVKTDKVYANTRRNNAEFGMCGYVASQLLSPILQRWKYILKPDAVGELTKANFERLKLDTINPWGTRGFNEQTVNFQIFEEIQINRLSKNKPTQAIIDILENNDIEITENDDGKYLLFDGLQIAGMEDVSLWIEKGFTKLRVYVGGISTTLGLYNLITKSYNKTPSSSYIKEAGTFELTNGTAVSFPDGFNAFLPSYVYPYTDDFGEFGSVIILLVPMLNNEELVEAGSFYLKGLPA